MPRLRQQHWFCLAAVCLAGSLVMMWSPDVRVAAQRDRPSAGPGLVRRAGGTSVVTSAPPKLTIPDQAARSRPILAVPRFARGEAVARPPVEPPPQGSMIAVPIPGSSGTDSLSSVLLPAGHEHPATPQIPPSVWFAGTIEATTSP